MGGVVMQRGGGRGTGASRWRGWSEGVGAGVTDDIEGWRWRVRMWVSVRRARRWVSITG